MHGLYCQEKTCRPSAIRRILDTNLIVPFWSSLILKNKFTQICSIDTNKLNESSYQIYVHKLSLFIFKRQVL